MECNQDIAIKHINLIIIKINTQYCDLKRFVNLMSLSRHVQMDSVLESELLDDLEDSLPSNVDLSINCKTSTA